MDTSGVETTAPSSPVVVYAESIAPGCAVQSVEARRQLESLQQEYKEQSDNLAQAIGELPIALAAAACSQPSACLIYVPALYLHVVMLSSLARILFASTRSQEQSRMRHRRLLGGPLGSSTLDLYFSQLVTQCLRCALGG